MGKNRKLSVDSLYTILYTVNLYVATFDAETFLCGNIISHNVATLNPNLEEKLLPQLKNCLMW